MLRMAAVTHTLAAPDILISDAANILSMWGTSLQMLPPDLARVSVWLRVAWTESQDLGRLVGTETVKKPEPYWAKTIYFDGRDMMGS